MHYFGIINSNLTEKLQNIQNEEDINTKKSVKDREFPSRFVNL